MFQRYNEAARRSMFFARQEAAQAGSAVVEPVHLMLGLLHEPDGLIALGGSRELAAEVRTVLQPSPTTAAHEGAKATFAPLALRVLRQAITEADDLEHPHIGPHHLLLAILAEDPSGLGALLISRGLTLDAARQKARLLTQEPAVATNRMGTSVSERKAPAAEKPSMAPSYDVHIEPCVGPPGTTKTSGPDFWAVSGYTLRHALAELYEFGEGRVQLLVPTLAAGRRFNITAVLPPGESRATMTRLIIEALERHFNITLTLQAQLQDVYRIAAVEPRREWGGVGSFGMPAPEGVLPDRELLAQVSDVLKGAAQVSSGASTGPVYVRRSHDLPDDLLTEFARKMGVVIATDRREMLMLVGRPRR